MRVYEEYGSKAEKKRAQRGAKRGVATGKARGYVLVFREEGHYGGVYESALGELLDVGQGPGAGPESIVWVNPSWDYLREKCRSVGFETIPDEWKVAFAEHLDRSLDLYQYSDEPEEGRRQRRRYRKILRHSQLPVERTKSTR